MVTIYDIAKKTGYSAPTVSKALNGTGKLNAKTRDNIILAAKTMGYEPNIAAKTLSTKKSNLIGVIYEDSQMMEGFEHPLFGGVLNKFREEVEKAGYDIIFLSRSFSLPYLSHARLRNVDGVIFINPNEDDTALLAEIAEEGIPCISTNDFIPGVCTVLTDNEKAGYDGTNYLISHGHTKIAFLSGPISKISPAAYERYKGYLRCLTEHKLPVNPNLFEESKMWDIQSGYDSFETLFKRTNDFTAIFAADDMLAFGILRYAKEHRISIPKRFSLIGFDDDRVAKFCNPRLTTFRQNREEIASLAAETLLFCMAGIPAPDIIRVPATLIERDSVQQL